MWQLIKRDFSVLLILFIFAVIFRIVLGAFSFFDSTNTYFYSFMFIIIYFFLFQQDYSSNVMQTIVSLPIKKSHIIISRYISIYLGALIIFTLNIFVDTLIEQESFHLINVYFAIIVFTMAMAVSTPIYYLFRKTWVSIVVQYGVIMVGIFATVFMFADPFDWFAPFIISMLDFIELQPYIIISSFLIILMTLSILFSIFLFKRKDLA